MDSIATVSDPSLRKGRRPIVKSQTRRVILGGLFAALFGALGVWLCNADAVSVPGSPRQSAGSDRPTMEERQAPAALSGWRNLRETGPGLQVADSAAAAAAATVVFAGVILDRDGALPSGGVMALVPGLPAIASPVRANGSFSMMLPNECSPGSFVRTQVSDSGGIIFSGLVRISENAIIHVVASRHEEVAGTVYLPYNDRTDPWFICLSHIGGGERSPLGADDGNHTGKIAEVRWTWMDKMLRRLEGPVDLLVLPMKPKLSALGHRRFTSFDEFRMALQSGLAVEAPKRSLKVSVPTGFGPLREIRLLSLENEAATYVAVAENGAYSISIPSGHYLVVAESSLKSRCSARLVVPMHEQWLSIALVDELPGPRSLRITLADAGGSPLANSYIALRASDQQGLRHSLLGPPADIAGAVAVSGLLAAEYDVFLYHGRRMEFVGRADLTGQDQQLDLRASARSIVHIDIGKDHYIDQIELASSYVWTKPAHGLWRQQSARDAALLGNAVELSESPSLVAVKCGDWAGCESWSAGATRMTIPLSPLEQLEGQVVSEASQGAAAGLAVEVCVSVLGEPLLPTWGTTRTDAEGRFAVKVPAQMLGRTVLVWRTASDNRVVATQSCASFEPGRPRLIYVP
jgi:hypothetical protein